MKSLLGAVVVIYNGPEDHSTPGGFLLAASLQRDRLLGEAMFDVDVSLFEYSNAVAGYEHVLDRVHLDLYHNGTVYFSLHAGSRIFTAHSAGLIKHVWRHSAEISTNENLGKNSFSFIYSVSWGKLGNFKNCKWIIIVQRPYSTWKKN